MDSVGKTGDGERAVQPDARWKSPAGLKILIPGYVQWSWRQRERAAVLFGSFAVAVGVGAFGWGTRMGLAILAFAFGTHVVSVVDVVRQTAFPGFGRWMPVFSASGGLALGVYGPALVAASVLAWPAIDDREPKTEGYLVNCWAFRERLPNQGDWLWLRSSPGGLSRVGRVVAGAGQEVNWSKNQMKIDGSTRSLGSPFRSASPPQQLTFVVPEGHVLVDSDALSDRGSSKGLVLVPREQIAGRAWARMYPLWERQLLR